MQQHGHKVVLQSDSAQTRLLSFCFPATFPSCVPVSSADMVRVGALRRISKSLLPHSLHAVDSKAKSDAVGELKDMLTGCTTVTEAALIHRELDQLKQVLQQYPLRATFGVCGHRFSVCYADLVYVSARGDPDALPEFELCKFRSMFECLFTWVRAIM